MATTPAPSGRVRPRVYRTSGAAVEDLEFALLGPLQVRRDSVPLPLGGLRQRAVLAYLLVHAGRWVTTDEMLEALGMRGRVSAAGTLHPYISKLRKIIDPSGSVIRSHDRRYLLDVYPLQLDSGCFEAELVAAAAARTDCD